MAIDLKRIEAAARAEFYAQFDGAKDAPEFVSGYSGRSKEQKSIEASVRRILSAAFPELSSDPPTGWVAPWEATHAIASAMEVEGDMDWLAAMATYEAARTAHLKEGT